MEEYIAKTITAQMKKVFCQPNSCWLIERWKQFAYSSFHGFEIDEANEFIDYLIDTKILTVEKRDAGDVFVLSKDAYLRLKNNQCLFPKS